MTNQSPSHDRITVTLVLDPHDTTRRASYQSPNPEMERLLDVNWWNLIFKGCLRAGNDPMPTVYGVKITKKDQELAQERAYPRLNKASDVEDALDED